MSHVITLIVLLIEWLLLRVVLLLRIVLLLIVIHRLLHLLILLIIALRDCNHLLLTAYVCRFFTLFLEFILRGHLLFLFKYGTDDFFDFLELMNVLANIRVLIFEELVFLVASLKCSYQIIIIIVGMSLGLLILLLFASSVILIVSLVVRKLVLVAFPRVIIPIVIIIPAVLIEALRVKEVTIRVKETY